MRKYFRKMRVPEHTHPLVKKMFEEMNEQRIGILDLAERSGVNRNTINEWKYRCMPRLDNLDACYNVLGMKLEARNAQ